jgi:CBS domain-containing protein
VFCSPTDLVSRCREIMFQLRIRHVPVIHNGEVVGIVLSKDLADSAFTVHTAGGGHPPPYSNAIPSIVITPYLYNVICNMHVIIKLYYYH